MARASGRRSGRARHGAPANALFVAAAVEALPCELTGVADEVTIHFPWGSLLRGVLDPCSAVVAGLACVTRPGAGIGVMLSITERDAAARVPAPSAELFAAMAPAYAAAGLRLTDARRATADEVRATHSTWARRIGAGTTRPAWLVRLERRG